jgi:hypothetical protein
LQVPARGLPRLSVLIHLHPAEETAMFHQLHVGASVVALLVQFAGAAGEKKVMSGPIMSVTESHVMVQRGTETVTLLIGKDTTITLNGKEAKVGDLKMNDTVEVSAEENSDNTFKALTIKATRSATKPTVKG